MNNTTDDSRFPPPPLNPNDSGDHPVIDARLLECEIALRIVAWLSTTEFPYYRDYVALVTEDAFGSTFMADLAFGIWRQTDASSWTRWRDVPGSSSVVWQYAILRAAALLNA